MLEKPVLFDVTERVHITNIFLLPVLEKPVLFDVTELRQAQLPFKLVGRVTEHLRQAQIPSTSSDTVE